MKVLILIGTRPEAIKLAPLKIELDSKPEVESIICVTGQHRKMIDQPLQVFGITPDYDLNIMTKQQTLSELTAKLISELDSILRKEKPDVVIVQGDTTTALCGAISAFYHKISVAHVEAGLRTGNKFSPFPEETNRCLISKMADYHFAPTINAKNALLQEGITQGISVSGNTVIDSLKWVQKQLNKRKIEPPKELKSKLDNKRIILITGHRRESFGEGFLNICSAVRNFADERNDIQFVYPVHLNPNVRKSVETILSNHPRIHLIDPLSYTDFIWLMNRSEIILTDSGGVQEEAPSLGKPVLVMRENTERPEGVEAGNAVLVGTDKNKIHSMLNELLDNKNRYDQMTSRSNPYGDGNASKRIIESLINDFTSRSGLNNAA